MLWLRVIQAKFGDALVLEHESAAGTKHWYLIDGGPEGNYVANVRSVLRTIAKAGGSLDVVCLSHVDNDHVSGLLELFDDLLQADVAGTPPVIGVGEVWHNSFQVVPTDSVVNNDVEAAFAAGTASGASMESLATGVLGQGEGFKLRMRALQLHKPLNAPFPGGEIRVDTAPPLTRDGLSIRVVSPSKANLDDLRDAWKDWLKDHKSEIDTGSPAAATAADDSIPNLSSVCLLVDDGTHSALLTGDARGDHILANLEALQIVPKGGKLHVNLLKMQHHGSDRNASAEFFDRVTAETYVFSANGKDGNPDSATLAGLAKALKAQGRKARIFVTNETPSTTAFRTAFPASEFGYTLTIMGTSSKSRRLPIG